MDNFAVMQSMWLNKCMQQYQNNMSLSDITITVIFFPYILNKTSSLLTYSVRGMLSIHLLKDISVASFSSARRLSNIYCNRGGMILRNSLILFSFILILLPLIRFLASGSHFQYCNAPSDFSVIFFCRMTKLFQIFIFSHELDFDIFRSQFQA